jgi:hypothetical protein
VSHFEIQQMCENGSFGRVYRISQVERRLRPSESPNVFGDNCGTNAVKVYKWIGAPVQYKTYKVLDDLGNTEKEIKVAKL